MPVIRFIREGRDVNCSVGDNLREVALRERMELYGLKGKLGNCGGYGQCSTCMVSIESGDPKGKELSPPTEVEQIHLKNELQFSYPCWIQYALKYPLSYLSAYSPIQIAYVHQDDQTLQVKGSVCLKNSPMTL